MKKTTIWKLSALLLSFAMCVAFVGCAPDSGNEPSGDTPSGGQTTDGGNTGDNTGDNNNKEPETPAVVTTVTEAEWKAAFGATMSDNVKWEMSNVMQGVSKNADGETENYTYTQNTTYVRDGNLLHTTMVSTATGEYGTQMLESMTSYGQPTNTEAYLDLEKQDLYLQNEDGSFRKIAKADWTELNELWWNMLNPFSHTIDQLLGMGDTPISDSYAKAKYDEEKKVYTITVSEEDPKEEIVTVAQFENGNLVMTSVTFNYEDESRPLQTVTYTFTYGGQSVTLPTVA